MLTEDNSLWECIFWAFHHKNLWRKEKMSSRGTFTSRCTTPTFWVCKKCIFHSKAPWEFKTYLQNLTLSPPRIGCIIVWISRWLSSPLFRFSHGKFHLRLKWGAVFAPLFCLSFFRVIQLEALCFLFCFYFFPFATLGRTGVCLSDRGISAFTLWSPGRSMLVQAPLCHRWWLPL